jgi:hypothetical protein
VWGGVGRRDALESNAAELTSTGGSVSGGRQRSRCLSRVSTAEKHSPHFSHTCDESETSPGSTYGAALSFIERWEARFASTAAASASTPSNQAARSLTYARSVRPRETSAAGSGGASSLHL